MDKQIRLMKHSRMGRLCLRAFRALLLLAVSAGMAAQGWAHDAGCQPGQNTGSSLRLMTYNTAFIVTPADNSGDFYGLSHAQRAELLADKILADDNDVIALQEVFVDDIKDAFISRLGARYPYYVRKVDNPDSPLNDSGLMLFSRFKFVPFTNASSRWVDPARFSARSNGANWTSVAVALFPSAAEELGPLPVPYLPIADCSGDDCWANKAAAMVRVQNECSGEIFSVAFTHLQASYEGDSPSDSLHHFKHREIQLKLIRTMILTMLTQAELSSQTAFLMGDLNIAGQFPNATPPVDNVPHTGYTEWDYTFKNPDNYSQGFYAAGTGASALVFNTTRVPTGKFFSDSWAYAHPNTDFGQTNGNQLSFSGPGVGERLDQVLHSKPPLLAATRRLAPQHMTRAYEMADKEPATGALKHYSDHLALRGDFNHPGAFFNPTIADEVLFGDNLNVTRMGKIQKKGHMQWYKITEQGTYSVSSGSNLVGWHIYHHSDLSKPINAVPGEVSPRYGPKYAMYDPPYYVRFFGRLPGDATNIVADRTLSDINFGISFHRYSCKSPHPDDSCVLPAAELVQFKWPANQALNADDMAWFSFHTDKTTGGEFPEVSFFHETPAPSSATLELREDEKDVNNNYSFLIDWNQTADSTLGSAGLPPLDINGVTQAPTWLIPDTTYEAPGLDGSGPGLGPKRYWLNIKRSQAVLPLPSFTSSVIFQTTLTYFTPLSLLCVVEDTVAGLDTINAFFDFDGADYTTPAFPGGVYLGDSFDNDVKADLNFFPLRQSFHRQLVPNLYEEPDASHLLDTVPTGFNEGSYTFKINSLFRRHRGGPGTFKWSNLSTPSSASYFYEMVYEAKHQP